MRYVDKDAALEAINDAPQFQNPTITKFDVAMFLNSRPTAALEIGDTISRQQAINTAGRIFLVCGNSPVDYRGLMVEALKDLPFAQPPLEEFEWCTDCKEYDQKAHCCHRFTKVIRHTVEELKSQPQRMRGRWIGYNADNSVWLRDDGEPIFLVCSECHRTVLNNGSADWNFCPNCGADMREEQDGQ